MPLRFEICLSLLEFCWNQFRIGWRFHRSFKGVLCGCLVNKGAFARGTWNVLFSVVDGSLFIAVRDFRIVRKSRDWNP